MRIHTKFALGKFLEKLPTKFHFEAIGKSEKTKFKLNSENIIIFAFCILVVVGILGGTQFREIKGWSYFFRGCKYLELFLVLYAFYSERTVSCKFFWIAAALATIALTGSATSSRISDLVLIIAFVLGSLYLKTPNLWRCYLIAGIVVSCFTLLMYITGIYEFNFAMRANGIKRLYLGFTWTTFSANYFFHFVLVYFAIIKRNINIWDTVVILIINYYLMAWTNTRAVYYEVFMLLGLLWWLRFSPWFFTTRLFRWGTLAFMPCLAVLSVYLSYIYNPGAPWLVWLNKLLSSRLALGKQAIELYGLNFFGTKTEWATGRASALSHSECCHFFKRYWHGMALQGFGTVRLYYNTFSCL